MGALLAAVHGFWFLLRAWPAEHVEAGRKHDEHIIGDRVTL
jgi:hypothetical protein